MAYGCTRRSGLPIQIGIGLQDIPEGFVLMMILDVALG